jgi:hypothetical protein
MGDGMDIDGSVEVPMLGPQLLEADASTAQAPGALGA